MYKAISALVENPQNNLRIFQNGVLVYGENKPPTAFHETMQNWLQLNAKPQVYLEKFCRLLSLALLTNFPANRADHVCAGDQTDPNPETAFSASCSEVTGENLPKDCVLKQIFALQQLDAMGPQGYAKGAESSDLELWKYIDHLLEEVNEHTHKCPKCVVGGILRRNGKARAQSEKDRCLFFVPYLLACVARDCSIMLSFGKVQDDDLRYYNVIIVFVWRVTRDRLDEIRLLCQWFNCFSLLQNRCCVRRCTNRYGRFYEVCDKSGHH